MFSRSNLKTLRSLLRFSLVLRSLVRSLTILAAFFSLERSLSRAADCLFSLVLALAFSQSLPFLVRTVLVRLRYRCYLRCCCSCRCFFGGGELWRYWPSGLWSRMSRHTSGGSITLTPVCTFCFLSLPSLFSCFLLLSCFLWALPFLLGLLVLWIQCVQCFLSCLFGILFNWK